MHGQDINRSFRLGDIIRKHIQQQRLDKEEQLLLTAWLAEDPENRKLFDSLSDEQSLANAIKKMQQSDTTAQWDIFNHRIMRRRTLKRIRRWVPVAAAVLLFFAIGLWYFIDGRTVQEQPSVPLAAVENDVAPGTNRATLVLDGGQSIVLNEEKNGIAVTGKGISYTDGTGILQSTTVQNAKLTTPRGGQYQAILPDGTKVWLNAESSLRYPTAFTGSERKVELTGEAYFEVAHDTTYPFIVKSGQQQITVLGTSFNVNAYSNEDATITTLLTGSIRLSSQNGTKKLEPLQQAVLKGGKILVKQVETKDFVAWKEGLIVLDRQDIRHTVRQLERWYNVEFTGVEMLPETKGLSGAIPRDIKLSGVLFALEQQTNMKFTISGRSVIVSP